MFVKTFYNRFCIKLCRFTTRCKKTYLQTQPTSSFNFWVRKSHGNHKINENRFVTFFRYGLHLLQSNTPSSRNSKQAHSNLPSAIQFQFPRSIRLLEYPALNTSIIRIILDCFANFAEYRR